MNGKELLKIRTDVEGVFQNGRLLFLPENGLVHIVQVTWLQNPCPQFQFLLEQEGQGIGVHDVRCGGHSLRGLRNRLVLQVWLDSLDDLELFPHAYLVRVPSSGEMLLRYPGTIPAKGYVSLPNLP